MSGFFSCRRGTVFLAGFRQRNLNPLAPVAAADCFRDGIESGRKRYEDADELFIGGLGGAATPEFFLFHKFTKESAPRLFPRERAA